MKKIIAPLLLPLPLSLLLLVVGLTLLWFTRRQKAGKVFVTASLIVLTFFSYSAISTRLLRPLEREFPPLALNAQQAAEMKWVVVLSGGAIGDVYVPPAGRLTDASLTRVVEGVRLHRELPGTKLLMSGGGVFGNETEAAVMRRVAVAIGVAEDKIVTEAESKDTEDQAQFVRQFIGDEPFILVTSAAHMPRSMRLFTKAGMRPTPAPTDFNAIIDPQIRARDFYPRSHALASADAAIHEYLGRLWARLRSKG